MSSPAFVLENVARCFGRKRVLDGVTAKAARGRVIGLLGRNGEGKSTLFRALLDLIAVEGRVEVLGLRPDGSGAIRARAGWVPERPVFHAFMTAGQALAWRRRFFASWDEARASATAKRLELDLSQPLVSASKGALAKLAWICATAHDPELLLLDEPTSGLDPLVREQVLGGLVAELQGSGKTIVIANHRMEELGSMIDELWVLSRGKIRGIYDAARLRTAARRLRGRLKPGADARGLSVIAISAEGPLVEWAALDEAAAREAACRLEACEQSPLPLPDAFSLLLREGAR